MTFTPYVEPVDDAELADRQLEARARSLARSRGFRICKSRRGESVDNYGGLMIVEADTNFVAAGERFDLSPADAVEWLTAE